MMSCKSFRKDQGFSITALNVTALKVQKINRMNHIFHNLEKNGIARKVK